MSDIFLELSQVLRDRRDANPDSSYVASLHELGIDKILEKIGEESTLNDVINDIEKRDVSDSSRDVSPLVQAKDAIAINTSNLTINEQVEKIVQIINK